MELVPVDHDPFAAQSPQLVPVEHDPFSVEEFAKEGKAKADEAMGAIAELHARGESPSSMFAKGAHDPVKEQFVRVFFGSDPNDPANVEKINAVISAYAAEQNGADPHAKRAGEVQRHPATEAGGFRTQGLGAGVREGGGTVQRPEIATGGAAIE